VDEPTTVANDGFWFPTATVHDGRSLPLLETAARGGSRLFVQLLNPTIYFRKIEKNKKIAPSPIRPILQSFLQPKAYLGPPASPFRSPTPTLSLAPLANLSTSPYQGAQQRSAPN
jgi:hypothetical protein